MLITEPDIDTIAIARASDDIDATCQRCLLCYEACPANAIGIKDYSGARQ